MNIAQVTYIWIDGSVPTQTLRSKVKIVPYDKKELSLSDLPQWSFDGSSTYQATGHDSDLILQPICMVNDPILGKGNYLALCEVLNPNGTSHNSNKRTRLVRAMELGGKEQDPWIGFEQEYTLFNGQQPLGPARWPRT